jgi:hypothetical protein
MPNALPADDRCFFITGCQRSGTTMLRLVLESHPEIACLDETRSYKALSTGEHDGPAGASLLGLKVPRLAEQLDQDRVSDLGLDMEIAPFYRGQRVLFLVRNFRDVIASMLKLRGATTWLEQWAVPIIRRKAQADPRFGWRWKDELDLCERAGSLPMFGALYWAYKNDALLRYTRRGLPVLPIGYEALVSDPRGELQRVCAFLGVPFEEALLDHPGHEHGELFASGLTVGNTDPKRGIDEASVGQWREWLSAEDVNLASAIAGPIESRLTRLMQGPPATRPMPSRATPLQPERLRSRTIP